MVQNIEEDTCKGNIDTVVAFLGLIVGVFALASLIYLAPSLKNQVDSLKTDIGNVSKSVQSFERRINEVDSAVNGVKDQLYGFEKTITVIELRRMLHTLDSISQNDPEATLQKTELIRENIRSILTDLGNEGKEDFGEMELQQE